MRIAVALAALLAGVGGVRGADCGPDRLGTSRVVEVGTQGGLEVGLKTYPRTIPLADHEVILTFDDGPAAKTTPQILSALAKECVRATFFEIGRNAEALPKIAREEVLQGETVAHHTYSHPQQTLRFMPNAAARADILKGMIAVEKAAYGQDFSGGAPKDLKDLKLHTPFFRFPGFESTPALLDLLRSRGIVVFGADLWASDWNRMTPKQELNLLINRLRAAGRGIILLHDPKAQTAAMLPAFLRYLRDNDYRVVHVVPTGPGVDFEGAP